METINGTFERRLADMNNGSTPRQLKRKLYSTFSTPTPNGRHGSGSKLLGSSDKRMKSILNEARAELFPSSAKSVFQRANRDSISRSDFRSPVKKFTQPSDFRSPGTKFSQFPPRPHASAARPRNRVLVSRVGSPLVLGRPERIFTESQLRIEWSSDAFQDAKERENEALRRENEDLRRCNLAEREKVERARAKELKQAMELEVFKQMVNAQSKRRDAGLGSLDYTPSPSGSSSRELVVSAGGLSRIQLLSEDEDRPSGSGGRESSSQEPVWRVLYNKIKEPSKIDKTTSLEKEIAFTESKLLALQLERPAKLKAEAKPEDKTLVGAFTPLSDEAELAVDDALSGGDRYEILVTHDKSNIDVTRAIIQCLSPGVWLNDEVINVYMDLLKERETREPDRFLKCHFFNTFFYNKLYKDKRSYDYKAIRRWTTQKKLGYSLSDCDKILVPIHQDIHWCLAVINIRDKQLEYLDSLKGGDRSVLDVLARYIADEAKDKDGKVLDVSSWGQGFPKDIPEQLNGCDCGVFMVKYADFHSRGAPLEFEQDNMDYFRRKMIWEILDLKAT